VLPQIAHVFFVLLVEEALKGPQRLLPSVARFAQGAGRGEEGKVLCLCRAQVPKQVSEVVGCFGHPADAAKQVPRSAGARLASVE